LASEASRIVVHVWTDGSEKAHVGREVAGVHTRIVLCWSAEAEMVDASPHAKDTCSVCTLSSKQEREVGARCISLCNTKSWQIARGAAAAAAIKNRTTISSKD
jgi:hypothetical protein